MNKNAGFTLIEVLIAMVVLAIGLLGLAGLQVTSLRNNQSAYNRSQATQLAYDLADRMRANRLFGANYVTTFMAPTAATCATSDTPCTACRSMAKSCTPPQLAVKDLFEWNNALTSTLPSGTGTITITGAIYTISVNWDDNRDGLVNNSDPNFNKFTMSFQLL
jgi:type IV pilus assembly protein PilV